MNAITYSVGINPDAQNNFRPASKQKPHVHEGHHQGLAGALPLPAEPRPGAVVVIDPAVDPQAAEGGHDEAEAPAAAEGGVVDHPPGVDAGRFPPVRRVGHAEEEGRFEEVHRHGNVEDRRGDGREHHLAAARHGAVRFPRAEDPGAHGP